MTRVCPAFRNGLVWAVLALSGIGGIGLEAQTLSGTALVAALQHGGYVMVMRHASSPAVLPDARTANPDNVSRERQLDDMGKAAADAMGRALKTLKIPVGEVMASPAYRTRETVRRLGVSSPRLLQEIGDNAPGMQPVTAAQTAWLRDRVRRLPSGTNALIVTHSPNISGAFPEFGTLAEGEALVFGRNGQVVARLPIGEWPRLAP
jgi:phosphohistidine phosphatase SixA